MKWGAGGGGGEGQKAKLQIQGALDRSMYDTQKDYCSSAYGHFSDTPITTVHPTAKAKVFYRKQHNKYLTTLDYHRDFKMAAASMGAFGTFKTQYSRYIREQEKLANLPATETVWVTKRYNPLDLRVLAPVPRHKLVVNKLPTPAEKHWVPVTDPPLRSFERGRNGVFASYPSTRDESWSTLRQMLPSTGSAYKVRPPNWGTGQGPPPFIFDRAPNRLPKVNSPMTRYAY